MIARIAAAAAAASLAFACAAAVPVGKPRPIAAESGPKKVSRPVALLNPGFENAPRAGERCPEHWGCTMHSDGDSFRFQLDHTRPAQGRQSLCIERVRDEPWALATQSVQAKGLHGARLIFSIALRVERAEGAGAGPWVLVHGPMGNLAHEERLMKGTEGGWQRVSLAFTVAPTAQSIEVGVTLQGGGRVCLDDARLEAEG